MQTMAHRIYAFIERVILNPLALLLIIGMIVVVVNVLMRVSTPEAPKPVEVTP